MRRKEYIYLVACSLTLSVLQFVNLEVVVEAKLLGVIIDKDLKWNKNTKYLVKEANKKMRMLHINLMK